jgi:hypothetical protein
MLTISNFALSQTLIKRFDKMFYAISINPSMFGKVCYNSMANRNSFCDNDYAHFIHSSPAEGIELCIQSPAFWEYTLYAPAKQFNEAEEHTYSEEKLSNW